MSTASPEVLSIPNLQLTECANKTGFIESIPDDVLATIFERGIEPNSLHDPGRRTPFEIVVSQVTRRWRGLANSLAILWSKISITPFQSQGMLDAYLMRSRNRLLDIDFQLGEYMEEDKEQDVSLTPSLKALMVHVERWRQFTLCSYSCLTIEQIIISIHALTTPNLTHFAVYLREHECRTPAFRATIFTGGAPCLSHFMCAGISTESCWPPLRALTDLCLDVEELYEDADPPADPLSRDRFIELLSSASALTHLKLKGTVAQMMESNTPSIIELPHLVTLSIDCVWDADYTLALCSIISCPALVSLTFCNIMMPYYIVNAFVEGFKDSPTLPKYPALIHIGFSDATCLELSRDFVAAFPTVTHLSFTSCVLDDLALDDILGPDLESKGSILWPNMQRLTIDSFEQQWSHALRAFIAARIGIGHPLQIMTLNNVDVDMHQFMQDGIDQGQN